MALTLARSGELIERAREAIEPKQRRAHFKVRVALNGSLLHLASWDEPKIEYEGGRVAGVEADWITNDESYNADTLGFIRWSEVLALTWRRWSSSPRRRR